MKRRLIVMRHAKSSWGDGDLSDHARPLNKRGRRDAPDIAERLVELEWTPELVLSSDAARTRETYSLMSGTFGGAAHVEYVPAFYTDGFAAIRTAVGEVNAEIHTVLALGHNPSCEEAVFWLCGEAAELTTANCALLESAAADWTAAVAHRKLWRLVDVIRPKEL
jgi:phosphohistidine phosphatase SixA